MVGGEGLENGVTHGRSLRLQQPAQTKIVDGLLLGAKEVVEPDAEDAAGHQDAAHLAPGQQRRPVPGLTTREMVTKGD